jgi:hypothetical protein
LTRAVDAFDAQRSSARLLVRGLSRSGIHHFKEALSLPAKENLRLMIAATS